ncbi:hypothetical protein ABEG10_00580 [Burkholderia cenocepacia]|jgi:hypothetical protein|nr:hypothetical protein [Burkholderia cenocepacia]AIO48138.1 hypothetical protein DM42_1665 [Burkholderia cepacia]KGB94362.1 hypothetical protein DM44_1513 [Burkholderia cepacia]MCG0580833.1 hypothetical protein [Burkholderia cenocepacia]MCW5126709.1 hypothetical protein [Burkholderia cenocepacia]MDN7663352.1 hypothetical protein [Burkholderia cenocepacia]
MIRYFLAKGDRAREAVIVEGLDTVTCSDPPPSSYRHAGYEDLLFDLQA